MKLSIIVPTLNEQAIIADTLQSLQDLRVTGHELILVDGHSTDGTREKAAPLVDQLHLSPRGRARQMICGVQFARHDILLFLHADTLLPPQADLLIYDGLQHNSRQWGRFDVRLSGQYWLLRIVGWFMNQRSRLTGIATGDQAIFVTRELYEQAGGYPDQPLMEDIEFSTRLKRHSPPLCLRQQVITSSRRWVKKGIVRTVLLMWWLRFAYALGVPAYTLKGWYDGH